MMMTLVMAIAVLGSVFANNEKVKSEVEKAFSNEFRYAQNEKWKTTKNFHRVDFTMGSKRLTAFYNHDAELIAVTRFLSPDELPGPLSKELGKRYAGYGIRELFELRSEGQINYYIALEGQGETVVLESRSAGSWKVYYPKKPVF